MLHLRLHPPYAHLRRLKTLWTHRDVRLNKYALSRWLHARVQKQTPLRILIDQRSNALWPYAFQRVQKQSPLLILTAQADGPKLHSKYSRASLRVLDSAAFKICPYAFGSAASNFSFMTTIIYTPSVDFSSLLKELKGRVCVKKAYKWLIIFRATYTGPFAWFLRWCCETECFLMFMLLRTRGQHQSLSFVRWMAVITTMHLLLTV